ncbi:MAG TPA: hypothetical protein PKZ16_03285 [bacterium]|nr:hypothetical protein [bacterium]HPL95642.1 hypothetical protein [bacterium]
MIFNLIYTLAALLIVANSWWQEPVVGVTATLFFIGGSSFLASEIGGIKNSWQKKFFYGSLFFLLLTVISLTGIYYLYQWNNLVLGGYIFLWVAAGWLYYFLKKIKSSDEQKFFKELFFKFKSVPLKNWFLFLFYLIGIVGCLIILFKSATLDPVRTPWVIVPKYFFVIYALISSLLIIIVRQEKGFLKIFFLSIYFLLSFSVAQIIFPLGYGYDALIHLAAEKHIANWGFILPKTFYYIGQYALVFFLAKTTALSTELVNSWLVPVLASCFLPATLMVAYEKLKEQIKINYLPLFFLLLTFAIFTFTTPQNLSDLMLIIFSFLIFNHFKEKVISGWGWGLLVLAIVLIHPVAGIAAFVAGSVIFLSQLGIKKVFFVWWSLVLCFLAPLAFLILSWVNPLFAANWQINWQFKAWAQNIFRFFPDLFLNTNFVHLIKTAAYFLWQPVTLFLMVFLLAIYGWKRFNIFNKTNNELKIINGGLLKNKNTIFLLIFLILVINSGVLFSLADFSFLINYERGDFSRRLFQEGVYFLYPLVFLAVGGILKNVREKVILKNKLIKIITSIILALSLTGAIYFSYPRHDVYAINLGFNTSIYDFRAVAYLDQTTAEPYVVLANQQAGAAALLTLGYRYFDNQYFMYSIPTGGPLYLIYTKMAYDGLISYEVAKEAMDLTRVNVVYLYLPDYWFNLKKIKPQLQAVADETIKIEDGKVWVFKFVRK